VILSNTRGRSLISDVRMLLIRRVEERVKERVKERAKKGGLG
jgi:hypothetical protein